MHHVITVNVVETQTYYVLFNNTGKNKGIKLSKQSKQSSAQGKQTIDIIQKLQQYQVQDFI